MNKNSKDYQEALAYFGEEQLNKFESEVDAHYKKQSSSIWKAIIRPKNIWIAYSISLTIFAGFQMNDKPLNNQEKLFSAQAQLSEASILETTGSFDLPNLNFPRPNDLLTVAVDNPPAEVLEVKQGDTLSTIAQKLLVKNNFKNSHKNRQRLIQELKIMNSSIEKSDFIKAGWQLKAVGLEDMKNLLTDL